VTEILLAPVKEEDIEIKPDGLIYLPEIKYRRILNQAFGPGGWAIMPRGETLNFQVRTHCNTFAVHVMLVYILTTSTGESCL